MPMQENGQKRLFIWLIAIYMAHESTTGCKK